MHVDGFRFDLASILSRGEAGRPLSNPPVLWDIESDPLLAGTKLIAEAWDAAGLYQVGSFVGDTWQEWNGRFRDDVRRFLRGDRLRLRRGHPCWGVPTFSAMRNGKPSRVSILSPAMTVLPSVIWSPTTTSTMRPTAKTIVMVRVTISAGTAARKAPQKMRRLKRYAIAR